MWRKTQPNTPLIAASICLIILGMIVGIALTGGYSTAGELQNVRPAPGGTILVPNNIIFSIRFSGSKAVQDFQCSPIIPHNRSTTNPENYSR
jgi:hypothetical protein